MLWKGEMEEVVKQMKESHQLKREGKVNKKKWKKAQGREKEEWEQEKKASLLLE
jgi:hypothetical protein